MPRKPPSVGVRASGKAWDHGGKSRHERGYGSNWERLRKRILARDKHLCQVCLQATPQRITPATQVDHITAKANGGSDHEANLRAICRPCHDEKTLADQGKKPRRRKRAIGADGWPIEE